MKNKIFALLIFFEFFTVSIPAFAAPEIIAEQCKAGSCIVLEQTTQGQIYSDTYRVGETIEIAITAHNPEQFSIYSTQTWMQYDSDIFEIVKVSGDNSDFPLAAPGEMKAFPQEGLIKIGRAVAGLPITSQKANIANITLKVLKNPLGAQLEFYDFRASDVGKTSLLTLRHMLPENILQIKPRNIIFTGLKGAANNGSNTGNTLGNNSGGGSTLNPNQYGSQTYGEIYGTQNPYISGGSNIQNGQANSNNFINIPRPKGLRSRTYPNGQTEHLWKMGEDSRIKGYYLYYSTTSGRYIHRRDVGRTNTYRFPAGFFETGKRTYFAIQAYDTSAKTSDFSDETYVVIGHSGSESHPFFEQIFPNVNPNEALIVTDKNGRIIYKGSRSGYKASLTTAKRYPTPQRNTQSGTGNILFFIFAGVAFFATGAYYYRKQKPVVIFAPKEKTIINWA